jgi:hypothetical protein
MLVISMLNLTIPAFQQYVIYSTIALMILGLDAFFGKGMKPYNVHTRRLIQECRVAENIVLVIFTFLINYLTRTTFILLFGTMYVMFVMLLVWQLIRCSHWVSFVWPPTIWDAFFDWLICGRPIGRVERH